MRRDLRKAEEEEKWREKANNRDQWRTTKVAVVITRPVGKRETEGEQVMAHTGILKPIIAGSQT